MASAPFCSLRSCRRPGTLSGRCSRSGGSRRSGLSAARCMRRGAGYGGCRDRADPALAGTGRAVDAGGRAAGRRDRRSRLGWSRQVRRLVSPEAGRATTWGAYAAVGVDLLSNGMMIGSGGAVAAELGVLLALSQVVANLPGGYAIAASFRARAFQRPSAGPRWRSIRSFRSPQERSAFSRSRMPESWSPASSSARSAGCC